MGGVIEDAFRTYYRAANRRYRVRKALRNDSARRPRTYVPLYQVRMQAACAVARGHRQTQILLQEQAAKNYVNDPRAPDGHPKFAHDPGIGHRPGGPESHDIVYHGSLWWRGEW